MSVPASFNDGDAAWVLICAALVLFMVPGLALFYAGMVRSRNALTMMLQNIVPIGVVSVLWVLFGYSIAFSRNVTGFIGDLESFGLGHLGVASAPALHRVAPGVTIPTMVNRRDAVARVVQVDFWRRQGVPPSARPRRRP